MAAGLSSVAGPRASSIRCDRAGNRPEGVGEVSVLREALIKAADSDLLRREVSTRALTRQIALRFVAGETLDEAMAVCHELAGQGRTVTLDYLGESVTDADEAERAAAVYLEAIRRVASAPFDVGVSVKPSQMGLGVDRALCRRLLHAIVGAAGEADAHVTLDMEGSDVTEETVRLVEELHADGHRNVGCAVQSYLRRTRADVERLSRLGASLRLCKGAYAEPPHLAWQARRDVDASFAACARWLLEHGSYPRIATHDDRLIEHVRTYARWLGRRPGDFELQMLYGVRPGLQADLVRDGYPVCVYVPFGDQWYPYLMRRLAERPANLVFFLRALRGG
jgi:proline dehydrogenase